MAKISIGNLFARIWEILRTCISHIFDASSGPVYLRSVVEDLGGGIIKLAQIAAMRYDFLPARYCRELSNLFEHVSPLRPDEVRTVFMEEFGKAPEDIFENFSYMPLAAASFGQVHRADLRGRVVAVKVQRPDAAFKAACDIVIIKAFSFILSPLLRLKAISIRDIVSEWEHWTRRELDYLQEAKNAENFRSRNSNPSIYIPEIIRTHTTSRIITEEFLEGRSLNSCIREGNLTEPLRRALSSQIIKIMLWQYFVNGFFHADPHPGNIFVLKDGRIGFVDFGIMGEVMPRSHLFAAFLRDVAYGDSAGAAKYFIEFTESDLFRVPQGELSGVRLPPGLTPERIEAYAFRFLQKGFSKINKRWQAASADASASLRDKSSTRPFLNLLMIAGKYGFVAPKEIISYIRALIIVDVVCLVLNPEFNMASVMKEFFEEHPGLARNIGDAFIPVKENAILSSEKLLENRWRIQERYLEQAGRLLERILEMGPKTIAGFMKKSSSPYMPAV
ncbi:MAG: AarF/ABC1/UbiB kinase family protein [Candidatus Sungbacteria bacterium]|nr:AarF/ABC1/UbiB kinase family protein [Candidatus Sungbacteria bacterium]